MKLLKPLFTLICASFTSLASAASISAELASTDPVLSARPFRTGTASSCGTNKPYPEVFGSAGTYPYRVFNFMNNGPARCVTITVDASTCSSTAIFASAYGGDFSPSDLASNYLGDAGNSDLVTSFGIDVPANSPVNILINGVNSDTTALGCKFTITSDQLTRADAAVPTPVPAVGIPALLVSALGIFGAAGFLTRRRKSH